MQTLLQCEVVGKVTGTATEEPEIGRTEERTTAEVESAESKGMLRREAPQHDKKRVLFQGGAILAGFRLVTEEVGGFGGTFESAAAARGGKE